MSETGEWPTWKPPRPSSCPAAARVAAAKHLFDRAAATTHEEYASFRAGLALLGSAAIETLASVPKEDARRWHAELLAAHLAAPAPWEKATADFLGALVAVSTRIEHYDFRGGPNLDWRIAARLERSVTIEGEAGEMPPVTTSDDELADRLRRLQQHGATGPFLHGRIGCNSRLDEIQAALLRLKLREVDAAIDGRRRVAGWYDAGFAASQCDAPCALQMATLVDGECAKTITGIVDQQDRVPNGPAERIDAQWARCVRVPAPELVALLAEVSCSGRGGGGHRRLQGASAEDLLRAYAAGDGSVCALLVAAPAPPAAVATGASDDTTLQALVRFRIHSPEPPNSHPRVAPLHAPQQPQADAYIVPWVNAFTSLFAGRLLNIGALISKWSRVNGESRLAPSMTTWF